MTSLQSLTTSLVLAGAVLAPQITSAQSQRPLDLRIDTGAGKVVFGVKSETEDMLQAYRRSLAWLQPETINILVPDNPCLAVDPETKKVNTLATQITCKSIQPERQFGGSQTPFDTATVDRGLQTGYASFMGKWYNRISRGILGTPVQTLSNTSIAPVVSLGKGKGEYDIWELGGKLNSSTGALFQFDGGVVTLEKKSYGIFTQRGAQDIVNLMPPSIAEIIASQGSRSNTQVAYTIKQDRE